MGAILQVDKGEDGNVTSVVQLIDQHYNEELSYALIPRSHLEV